MTDLAELLAANKGFAAGYEPVLGQRPRDALAVITCIDARIDALSALGLRLGDANVIRNAGGRVTDDVLRSLAVATHLLGVETVVVMQHTNCGVAGVSDAELRERTGADLDFRPIDDHATALRADVDALAQAPFLSSVTAIAGLLYDVTTGLVSDVVDWRRT
ncbi:MAG: beta-class carbonic anhydrase [Mycobacteriales bacterium]|nr:carbonic anhydrase [Frankia sp.]